MTLTNVGVIYGVVVSMAAVTGTGLKFYGDNTYLLIADSLKGQLYQKQEQIFRLEQQCLDPSCTSLEKPDWDYLKFLKLQEKKLQIELE